MAAATMRFDAAGVTGVTDLYPRCEGVYENVREGLGEKVDYRGDFPHLKCTPSKKIVILLAEIFWVFFSSRFP